MAKKVEMIGKRFGKLTVVAEAKPKRVSGKLCIMYECICECGNTYAALGTALRSNHTWHCGCVFKRADGDSIGKKTRLYHMWRNMNRRCSEKNNNRAKNYIGRGISVCDEWKTNYKAFKAWALETGYDEKAPYGKCTLDRINVNGNYEPSNCRFADMKTQANNTTYNRPLAYKGETRNICEWEDVLGFRRQTIGKRLKRGWSIERAIETPVKGKTIQ
jgi:hypothetical protein